MALRAKNVRGNRKYAYLFVLVSFFVFLMLYRQTPNESPQSSVLAPSQNAVTIDLKSLDSLTRQLSQSSNISVYYIVNSSKCKIPSTNPFDREILPYFHPNKYTRCTSKNLLTFIAKTNNVATLHIDERHVPEYSTDGVSCCYSIVTRSRKFKTSDTPDIIIDVAPCIKFQRNVTLHEDYLLVICKNGRDEEIYRNTHATVTINKEIQQKLDKFNSPNEKPLNVLLVGIDSVSRMNAIRSLPKTHSYLQENSWIQLKGYNKNGDNTFPNLMGILSGMNETTAYKVCNPKELGKLDECNLVWYDYRRLGFVTGYGEDEAYIGTFNFRKLGFTNAPVDYYFRPYILASEDHLKILVVDDMKYCTGPENSGERIFKLAEEFSSTFKNHSNFGFFWTNSFSHNEINSVSRMDDKILDFLRNIAREGVLDNSIVMFISDHGFRFGTITYTYSGWLEDRLPFFYVSVPNWFKEKFAEEYENLVKNAERLTSPFDIYMTLQDILVKSGKQYEVKKSSACPKCRSLFEEVEMERSCADAGIEKHWCTCTGYFTIPATSLTAEIGAKFILNEIRQTQRNTAANFQNCMEFEINKIISAGISGTKDEDLLYFLITFETIPKAVFQGTISINKSIPQPVFHIEGTVSRLDYYGTNSWCVDDAILKKYCYCPGVIKFSVGIFRNFMRKIFNILS